MRRLRDETGSVLAMAILSMALLVTLGLATFAYVDTQTRESGNERVRETSFNVGEQLLGSQVFVLSRAWPGAAANAYPTSCVNGSTNARCPNGAGVVSAFGGPDVAKGVVWETRVRDNIAPANTNFYSDSALANAATWDANGDGRVWVRAQARIGNRRRTMVGLVRVEQVTEQFPKNTITTGKFETGNNGNKVIVDTQGSSASPGNVHVRCGSRGPSCADYRDGQVSPDTVAYNYPNQTALSPAALDRLRERAQADGRYYATGCPASLAGPVVFVENASCQYQANSVYNSQASPGTLVWARGTLTLRGGAEFYGVIYHANLDNSTGNVIDLGGNSLVTGSVAIDGVGGITVGQSKMNLVYDANATARVVSYGNAGIIQNTWREIPA